MAPVGSDDKTELAKGKLTLIDNQVDTATGTIHLKATFDNADERLWPGEFVNARLVLSTRKNAVTVPPRTVHGGRRTAITPMSSSPTDTVERRTVEVAEIAGRHAVIARGWRRARRSSSTASTG